MAIGPRLDLRQSQSLVMTPQLQQAIKLLQLSNLDLQTYVDQELERNPLLEREDDALGEAEPVPERPDERRDGNDRLLDSATGDAESPLDMDVDNTFTNDSAADADGTSDMPWTEASGRQDFGDPDRNLEETLSGTVSLRDHVAEQIMADFADPAERLIAGALAEHLDEAGYLTVDVAEVARDLGTAESLVESVLAGCQRFDPTGLFARSLQECLALQLADRNRLDPAMAALLERLDLLAARDFAAMQRACGVDAEDLADMIAEIRALNPKPALALSTDVAAPVIPDILVRRSTGGDWIVDLNAETMPRVLVNHRYSAQISSRCQSRTDRSYLSEQLASANWLVKALHQRATTILKVATELVRRQDGFLQHGISHLRPLVLRDIAEAIGMHESTVSRVTNGKYMATPRGTFELKYFFTQAIAGTAGSEAHSAATVKHRIKTLIDAEPPAQVLSDDALVAHLRAEGIDIARRTVAKYREALNIPSSVQRRREKVATRGGGG